MVSGNSETQYIMNPFIIIHKLVFLAYPLPKSKFISFPDPRGRDHRHSAQRRVHARNGGTGAARSRALRPDLTFVFSSGYKGGEFLDGLHRGKTVYFIGKPYTMAQLAEIIRKALGG